MSDVVHKTISVIICTKDRLDDFKETIVSLLKQTRLPDEMVVVDSSENENVHSYLKSVEIPFVWSYFHTVPGLTHQRNVGIEKSIGDLLFFFDDDVDLENEYIGLIEKTFKDDLLSVIGAVGGRIINSQQVKRMTLMLWLKRKFFNTLRHVFMQSDFGNGQFRYSGMPSHPHLSKTSRYIECLSGCCMAFRREVFRSAQFDENLSGYGCMEDADISKQVLNAGYKIYYSASATLIHKVSPQDRLKIGQLAEMTVINYAYLFRKNWPQNLLRRISFFWTLLGLFLINGHSLSGRRGVINGIMGALLRQKDQH